MRTRTSASVSLLYCNIGEIQWIYIKNFTTVADPAIRYDGTLTQWFEIDWHASLSCNSNGRTVSVGIKKNGTIVPSPMSTFLKTANEIYALSGTCITELNLNDKIQLVVTSDYNGDIINFLNYTTTIAEFFD